MQTSRIPNNLRIKGAIEEDDFAFDVLFFI